MYVRWGMMLLAFGFIGVASVVRYNKEVSALSPEQLIRERPEGVARVLGRVKAGTLQEGDGEYVFEFTGASGGMTSIQVRYHGKPYENMRELKVLVIEGEWDTGRMEFAAQRFHPLPNYGFITAAYLLSLILLGIFLFGMERSVLLLSILIKEEKGYQRPDLLRPELEGTD